MFSNRTLKKRTTVANVGNENTENQPMYGYVPETLRTALIAQLMPKPCKKAEPMEN